jgi:hypothetical protein
MMFKWAWLAGHSLLTVLYDGYDQRHMSDTYKLKMEVLRRVEHGESLDSLAGELRTFFTNYTHPESFFFTKIEAMSNHPSTVPSELKSRSIPIEWIRKIADAGESR